jgi:hypothetical protein
MLYDERCQRMYHLEGYGKALSQYMPYFFAKDDGFYYNQLVHF